MIVKLYNDNPNVREVRRIADALRSGEVVILPTDTLYAFAASMEHKHAVEEIAQLCCYASEAEFTAQGVQNKTG